MLLQTDGRPKYLTPKDQIERLHSCGMTWTNIAKVLHISERTLYRRQEYGILEKYSNISDSDFDSIIRNILSNTPNVGGGGN